MRDLNADLAICEAVTEVFYDEGGGYTASGGLYEKETDFFEQASHGWPEAIRRAIEAESILRGIVGAIDRGDLRQVRMSSGVDYTIGLAKRHLIK